MKKRKRYREYTKTFEDNGLKWEEAYVIIMNRRHVWSLIGSLPSGLSVVQRMRENKIQMAATFIFKFPSDEATAVYWAMSHQHQDDAKVLAELKAALDA